MRTSVHLPLCWTYRVLHRGHICDMETLCHLQISESHHKDRSCADKKYHRYQKTLHLKMCHLQSCRTIRTIFSGRIWVCCQFSCLRHWSFLFHIWFRPVCDEAQKAWLIRRDNKTDLASGFGAHCVSPCRQASQAQLFCNTLKDFHGVGSSIVGPSFVTFASFPLLARLGALALGLVTISFGCSGKGAVHLQGWTTSQAQVLQAADKPLLLRVLARTERDNGTQYLLNNCNYSSLMQFFG